MKNEFEFSIIANIFFVLVIAVLICFSIKMDKETKELKKIIETSVITDSIYLPVEEKIDTIIVTEFIDDTTEIKYLTDIIHEDAYYIDSIEEELFIAQYKLEQIRNYNEIAAKNNNIKYLRGWINRVLNE